MPKLDLWTTRRGWIFCLNSDYDSPSGSNWGYVEDFLDGIESDGKVELGYLICESSVYGRVCIKDGVLRPGDGLAFYHGKKARRSIETLKPVRPYQITMLAEILEVHQMNRDVDFIRFGIPQRLFSAMRKHPLIKDDRVGAIIESSGLGGGRVGSYFPLAAADWSNLLRFAKDL